MPFKTAQENSTITQIEANAVFRHRELGISADLPFFSRHHIHVQNPGIMAVAIASSAMFSAFCTLDGLSVITL